MNFDEKIAEEYYYENYPVTLNIGEEERKKAIINVFLAALKKGSQLDKVWHDYYTGEDSYEYSHKGKWVNRNSELEKNYEIKELTPMFKKFNFKNEYIHCVPLDENLIGKRVLFGDTWTDIKGQVESNNWTSCRRTLKSIDYESCCPFIIDNDFKTGQYKFIYYDPEWEIEKAYYCYLSKDEPEFIFDNEKPSSHVYAEFTSYFEANEWCNKHDRHALEAKAWEEGKTIQRKNVNGNWEDCEPEWDLNIKYRVKPNCVKCEDLKIGDIISDGKIDYMVLGLNHSGGSISDVFLPCIGWRCDADLKNFYKK